MNKRFFAILGIVSVGFLLAVVVVKTAPKPIKKATVVKTPLVEVSNFSSAQNIPSWQGGASVNANKSVNLIAQISGQIVSVNSLAVPGRYVKKGALLATIDDANYQLVLQQAQAKVVQAQSSLDMELAQVENAKKDYQRSGIKLHSAGKALALRQPQLASAKAALKIANSDLKKAQLDLARTRLLMPFDGHVLSQNLSEGAFVSNTSAVFEVLNSEQYWLEVKVPQEFIDVLDMSHKAQINKLNKFGSRNANILTILPQVDAMDRQARVLLSIDNPLAITNENLTSQISVDSVTDQNPIAIRYNDYVQVTLFGKSFGDVSKIETDALNGGSTIWVVDANSQLQQRAVTLLYSGRQFSWVKIASQTGDKMLMSRLDFPLEGQAVRLLSSKAVAPKVIDASSETEVAGQ